MFTEEQQQEILNEALQSAKEKIVEQATSKLSYEIEWAVKSTVSNIVDEWARDELKPALVERLSSEKSQIIEAAMEAGQEIAVVLTKSLVTAASENLSDRYKRGKVLEDLFR
jgi:Mg/Co/Ni transporter MgtE